MTGPLVLIEPYADRLGGHHQRTLVALARARPGSLVIAPNGIARESVAALRDCGSRLVTAPVGLAGRLLLAAARLTARTAVAGQHTLSEHRRFPRLRRLPHQVTLVARCLTEASALRTARGLESGAGAVVILTASEALHGAATLLGGQPHLRFIHETVTTEDAALRLVSRIARRGERRAVALYPTAAVAGRSATAYPALPSAIRPFAVDDGRPVTDTERRSGRAAFGIPAAEAVVCLVGGWWPYKDIATVEAALSRLAEPLHLVVVGAPLDESVLARWRKLPWLSLHAVPGPVGEMVLRLVYATADAALVARHAGVGKESGLVMDAVRLRVPLIVSDHDPALTERLRGRPWALSFPAGDPNGLLNALHTVVHQPPPRPGPEAPHQFGMPTADEQADFLAYTFTELRRNES